MHLKGYGCAGRSAVEYGLAAMELEAGDSGLRTFVCVQGSLAMSAIAQVRLRGAEAAVAARAWPPGELIGCFGLTEPDRRQRPGEHDDLRAVRDGTDWVLDRRQAVDRAGLDRRRRGHLGADRRGHPRASSCPTDTPGFTATPIEPKLSMRASIQCDITLDDVRLPADAVLPERPRAARARSPA